jgi:hypothetical protein
MTKTPPDNSKKKSPNWFGKIFFGSLERSAEAQKTLKEKRAEIMDEMEGLKKKGIDPLVFHTILVNDTNRELKIIYARTFTGLTVFFTVASYAIVVCNIPFKWNISPTVINALMVETPIQFIGILYIIAKNLFPK